MNPVAGHESTLLRVSSGDNTSRRYLIDAGEIDSPSAFIGPEESLDGLFLTHAHRDHYAGLSNVLSADGEIPLYTSPATATILKQVYTEADRYQDLGDFAPIADALTPIDGWVALDDGVYVLPVPAGHTPGATGFLFRIDDPPNQETVTVLATGDFTARPVAGYPGFGIPDSIDIDVLIGNATTTDDFEQTLSEAVEVLLERALGGATTLVAAGGLTGVHVAYLLGHLLSDLDRQLPIHLVGQAAKLYTDLEYDVPFVTAQSHFEHTDEVLEPSAITIAGPEAPTQGSTSRLYGVVEDNPDALFVQLTTSNSEPVDGAACATQYFELSNHPTEDQFIKTVEENLPRHLVFKHVRIEQAKSIGSTFENLFHWGNDDTEEHILYRDGDWPAPPWVSDQRATMIRRRNFQDSGSRTPIDRSLDQLPSIPLARQPPALTSEGVDVAALKDQFAHTAPPEPVSPQEPASADGGQGSSTESADEVVDDKASGDTDSDGVSTHPPQVDREFQSGVLERLEAIESRIDELTASVPTEDTVETRLDTLETHLGDIETTLEELPDQLDSDESYSVTGTVLRQEDLVLFRVDPDAFAEADVDLEHDQEIELAIRAVRSEHSQSNEQE